MCRNPGVLTYDWTKNGEQIMSGQHSMPFGSVSGEIRPLPSRSLQRGLGRILVGSRATLKLSARFQPSVSGLLTTRVAPSVTAFIGHAPITAYKRRCCSRSYETRLPVPDERGNRMDNIGRPACFCRC